MTRSDSDGKLIVSYLTLRRVVGILGIALPVILAIWGFFLLRSFEFLPSISDYYSLRTRDAFVGILFTIAWFLFTYRGYDRKDNIAGNLACLFALGVALFPNTGSGLDQIIHIASAFALFLMLSYFSMFLFTKSGDIQTPQKKIRNRIYKACGMVILICIALIGLYFWFLADTSIARLKPVFWLETFALWSFGLSWFIKGETLLTDKRM